MNYSSATLEKFSSLPVKKRRAIVALLAGQTNSGAAAAAGVGRTALSRWREDEEFKAVREAMQAENASAQLSGLSKIQAEAMKGLAQAVEFAQREVENPDGDQLAACHFLERVAEKALSGYGIGPGGKVGADSQGGDVPVVQIYLPSNGRPASGDAQIEGREDEPADLVSRFKNAE